jgi:hypothetical protein
LEELTLRSNEFQVINKEAFDGNPKIKSKFVKISKFVGKKFFPEIF